MLEFWTDSYIMTSEKGGGGGSNFFHVRWPIWLAPLSPQFYPPRFKEHCWVSQTLLALQVNATMF